MNLQPLLEMQDKLDQRIKEQKGLQGVDLLDKKILALQVELGELANEWRGFKFWSENQEARTSGAKSYRENIADIEWINPLLEEYVDCLHFILSIGNDLNVENPRIEISKKSNIINQFSHLFDQVRASYVKTQWQHTFSLFLGLGEMLGFTLTQIEQAYYDKNKINHERQANGY